MIFNSLQYLVFFAVVALVTVLFKFRQNQVAFLLFSSCLFYLLSSSYLILCLFFVSLITYFAGQAIYRESSIRWRRFYLAFSVIYALGQLGLFKYSDQLSSILSLFMGAAFGSFANCTILDASCLLMPLGISFYTFQSLSYVFDIYLGRLRPTPSLKEYILFVAFFPQITSGPIVRARDFLHQIGSGGRLSVSASNLKYGITLIGIGLIKKMVIADNLVRFVDPIFADPTNYNSLRIILATIIFAVQLYCDFSGYSDIAIGSVRILGLRYPANFNNPYLALNPSDFWRRWHISLSSFLRDYLYIPLGGNRAGVFRTHLNLLLTMTICGLWHGSSWNFLIWGAYHGFLLSAHRLIFRDLSLARGMDTISKTRYWTALGVLATQYLVSLGWLIFRVNDLNDLIYCLNKFIFWDFLSRLQYPGLVFGFIKETMPFLLLFGFYVALIALYRNEFCSKDWVGMLSSLKLKYWMAYLMAVIFALIWFSPGSGTNYIYSAF
ncbi:MAG: MBOAT family protein [Methanosaeta sp. PtaU1.Bin112]|nr:MAG: MBOAT family protein [Methanosaeta sp. PtaU1.Bin112]